MAHFLYRLGRRSAQYPWRVLGAWLAVLLLAGAGYLVAGGNLATTFSIPGTATDRVTSQLEYQFPDLAGMNASVVFTTDDGQPFTDTQRQEIVAELDTIESHLSFLASVGSVSPYVGLFGTVWGIMHAFVGLSNLQQVTLATVAPGIAEALVATAIGLFAAIPAVVAYNRFAREIDRIAIQMETFMEEFLNILQRNAGAPAAAAR